MKKKLSIIVGIVIFILCFSIFSFVNYEYNETIKIAIYPEGMYSESYYFELTPTGNILVEKGARTCDELTQSPFIQSENPYKGKKNMMFEYEKEKTHIAADITKKIYALVNDIYKEENIITFKSLTDGWDIQILYKGNLIKQNLDTEYTLPQINELVNVLELISPVEVDLRGFA